MGSQYPKERQENIAQSGDLVLAIGTPANTKLLVSADVLKRASKVFAALLGPNFREGQKKGTSARPKEIELPEDNAKAMKDMCNLLHGNNVPAVAWAKSFKSPQILAFAIVVDKYACAEYLHFQSQAILLAFHDRVTEPSMAVSCWIAAASYLLNQPLSFSIATERLTKLASNHHSHMLSGESGRILPASVIPKSEDLRLVAKA